MSTGSATRWTRYIALGDSFTEGMTDPVSGQDDVHRGWADRLAEILHARSVADGGPGLEYANLAVRGRLLPQILGQQLPVALRAGPDLVSLVGGGNDVLRPGSDPDVLAERLEGAVAQLRESGADVLMATGVDPRNAPLIKLTRGKVATYNCHIWSIAARHGARVIDQWGMTELHDWRMWADDRIHLSSAGHRRVALAAAAALGISADDDGTDEPLPPLPVRSRRETVLEDAAWARSYVAPWVRRRLRGQSSGDDRQAKRPEPLTLEVPD
jgi:lysophospholipase L1-like esterase